GKDQLLNFAHARTIMRARNQKPEVALTTPVLEGTSGDGRKMSKTYNNYISVPESAEEKFGKVMSIPDTLIAPSFVEFAGIKKSEIQNIELIASHNPFEAKKQLAQFIVAIDTGSLKDGIKERERFEKKFSARDLSNSTMPSIRHIDGESLF